MPETPLGKAITDVVAGTAGGVAICLVGHPFDTLKVRLQTQAGDRPLYNSAWDCFKKTIKWEVTDLTAQFLPLPLTFQHSMP